VHHEFTPLTPDAKRFHPDRIASRRSDPRNTYGNRTSLLSQLSQLLSRSNGERKRAFDISCGSGACRPGRILRFNPRGFYNGPQWSAPTQSLHGHNNRILHHRFRPHSDRFRDSWIWLRRLDTKRLSASFVVRIGLNLLDLRPRLNILTNCYGRCLQNCDSIRAQFQASL
jgi:hypothetical protein